MPVSFGVADEVETVGEHVVSVAPADQLSVPAPQLPLSHCFVVLGLLFLATVSLVFFVPSRRGSW